MITTLFYPHYSVLVVIDDSRMVNDDSMVTNSWWLYVIMALFYPHYSVFVVIDDSRMVNDDSMVTN